MEDPAFERPRDFIQWWIENMDQKREDTYAMAGSLVGLNFAGIRSTGVVVCHTPIVPPQNLEQDSLTIIQKQAHASLLRPSQ